MPTLPQTLTLGTLEELKVYFDPIRQKILRLLVDQPKTVKEILATNYVYKPVNKNLLVGCWEGTESVEMLLALRKK